MMSKLHLNYRLHYVIIISFQMLPFLAQTQEIEIDSLKQIISSSKQDTTTVNLLNDISIQYLATDELEKVREYGVKSMALADKLNYSKGKAYALKNMGLADYYEGNYEEVFDFWTRSLNEFERIDDTLGIANMSSNLGVVYYDQGSHDKALDYYLKSLSFSEKLNDPKRITTALVNIGGLYTQMEDYEKALDSYKRMEVYFDELNNTDIEATYLMGIGEIYSLQDDSKKAITYYEEALALDEEGDSYVHILIMLGKEDFKLGNKERALIYLNKAYSIAGQQNLQLDLVQSLLALGDIYQSSDPIKAIEAYEEGVFIAKIIQTQEELRDIYKGMSLASIQLENYKDAYTYQNKYLLLKDSIFNVKTDDKIRGLQFDFDLSKKQDEIGLLEKEAVIQELNKKRQKNIIYAIGGALFLIGLLSLGLYRRYRFIQETNMIIEKEKNRSEELLLNILPEETAQELKESGKVKAKRFESVTVLFTDFVGFTAYAKNLEPEELVNSVDYYFSKFDGIMEKFGVEKIKTIGDAYMCAAGLPEPDEFHVFRALQAAFEIIEFIKESKNTEMDDLTQFDVRIGMNTGPIVAGVVGTKKFAYDIWGDSVNVASRMETKSLPGRINISESTYELIKDVYECEYRGEIDVKNKGMMKMYFVKGIKDKAFISKLEFSSKIEEKIG